MFDSRIRLVGSQTSIPLKCVVGEERVDYKVDYLTGTPPHQLTDASVMTLSHPLETVVAHWDRGAYPKRPSVRVRRAGRLTVDAPHYVR